MDKKYYAVTAKFGHVGRGNCLIKTVPTMATDGKKAAENARWMARAKHHAKDAIISVTEITEEQYELLKEKHEDDAYFSCKNIQDQRLKCPNLYEEIQPMRIESDYEERRKNRKLRINFQRKRDKIINSETRYFRNYQLLSCAY